MKPVKLVLLTLFCMTMQNAWSFKTIKGDGKVITKSFPISNYNQIEIAGSGEFDYTQCDDVNPALEVSLDENIFDCMDIYVKDNVLVIRPKKDYNGTAINPTVFHVKSNSVGLSKLKNTGSCNFNILMPMYTSNLDIDMAGSGSVVCQSNMKVSDLNVKIAGSGSLLLKGDVAQANIHISGSGGVVADECRMNSLECHIAGSGDVKAWVTDYLSCNIAGSGNITYKGNPQLKELSVSGSGKVKNIN